MFKKQEISVLFRKIKKILGFSPKNINSLIDVFVYNFYEKKSHIHEKYFFNFQRLEFLGDSVLNTIISHILCEKYPEKKEGELTQIRSKIVCRKNLNELSKKLTIYDIFLDKTMISNNNVLGNTLEALIGFVYLEIGYQKCKNFVYEKILHNHINFSKIQGEIFRYKVWMIEWCQKNKFSINFNTFLDEKNKNNMTYISIFTISESNIHTQGVGFSKKTSEEIAAKKAYFLLLKRKKKN
ncbi:ribonuclease III family protein [Blattabacterium cuenoti]|uniref:ribonuclease III family protein n=1 Tax=Blattabacterium cuenoti TaxID=1653831 RepID=UPI001EEAB279|nr:ribonuclease III domain-containing protein [Blattabacterium cuenoti]